MKKINLFAPQATNRFLNLALNTGLTATESMSHTPDNIEPGLCDYFKTLRPGRYFSITKRAQMKQSSEAKNGVTALQKTLRNNGIMTEAETELKNANSDFRQALEGTIANPTTRKLFEHSLRSFDQTKKLNKSADGDYYHSTRLAVAYFQFKNRLTIDGVFGNESYNCLTKNTETTTTTRETKTSLKKHGDKITSSYTAGKENLNEVLRMTSDVYQAVEEDLDGKGLLGSKGLAGLLKRSREGSYDFVQNKAKQRQTQQLLKNGLDTLLGRKGQAVESQRKVNELLTIAHIALTSALGSPDVILFSIRTGILKELNPSIGIDKATQYATWAIAVIEGKTKEAFGKSGFEKTFDDTINESRQQLARIDQSKLSSEQKEDMSRAIQSTVDTYLEYHYQKDVDMIESDSFNWYERITDAKYEDFAAARTTLDQLHNELKNARTNNQVLPRLKLQQMVNAMCLIQKIARQEHRKDHGFYVEPTLEEVAQDEGIREDQIHELTPQELQNLRQKHKVKKEEAVKNQKEYMGIHRTNYELLETFNGTLELRASFNRASNQFEYFFEGMADDDEEKPTYPINYNPETGKITAHLPSYEASTNEARDILQKSQRLVHNFEKGAWKEHRPSGFRGSMAGLEGTARGKQLVGSQKEEQYYVETGRSSIGNGKELLRILGYNNLQTLIETHKNSIPKNICKAIKQAIKTKKQQIKLPDNVIQWFALNANIRFPKGKAWADTWEFPVTFNMLKGIKNALDKDSTRGNPKNPQDPEGPTEPSIHIKKKDGMSDNTTEAIF